jgi:hypothetical protein
LILFVPGQRETLRVTGRAIIVRDQDAMAGHGQIPDLAVIVKAEKAFFLRQVHHALEALVFTFVTAKPSRVRSCVQQTPKDQPHKVCPESPIPAGRVLDCVFPHLILRILAERQRLIHRFFDPRLLLHGGFTKNDDIEWAHAKDIKMWCPPGQTRHGTDPYAPKKDDGVGVADWRERMKGEEDKKGEALYRLRAEHECINAHARRMGLRQLSLRGKIKARIHLLWFAVARNTMRFLALHAKAQAAA